MDSVMNGLMSNNGWIIALLIAVIAFLIIKSAKAGLFSFKSDKIKIGKDARLTEQAVIRHQIEFAKTAIEGFERDIPKSENYDQFRGRYILEKLFDEVINWIIFNHIERTKTYVSIKQDIIISIIKKHTINDIYAQQDFVKQVKKYVEYMINKLVDIREEYQDEV